MYTLNRITSKRNRIKSKKNKLKSKRNRIFGGSSEVSINRLKTKIKDSHNEAINLRNKGKQKEALHELRKKHLYEKQLEIAKKRLQLKSNQATLHNLSSNVTNNTISQSSKISCPSQLPSEPISRKFFKWLGCGAGKYSKNKTIKNKNKKIIA
jgi:hypothetical protein